jgi:flagellar secretion chaperone FliS
MSIHAYKNQQEWEILSASPLDLVCALYRGAIQSVGAARTALASKDIKTRSAAVTKACAILQELTMSLDMNAGGQIARSLSELYIYMHQRLCDANIEQSDAPLAEVEKLLETLCEAWEEIRAQQTEDQTGEPLLLSA